MSGTIKPGSEQHEGHLKHLKTEESQADSKVDKKTEPKTEPKHEIKKDK